MLHTKSVRMPCKHNFFAWNRQIFIDADLHRKCFSFSAPCVDVVIGRTQARGRAPNRTGRHISNSNSNVIRKCEQLATGRNQLYCVFVLWGPFLSILFCCVSISFAYHCRLTPIHCVALHFFSFCWLSFQNGQFHRFPTIWLTDKFSKRIKSFHR